MTEGYITVRDVISLAKEYIIRGNEGFTKSITECQTYDATLEDGRYIVSVQKIANIYFCDGKNMVMWFKPDNVELYNVYVGGWYNEANDMYEVEEVRLFNNIHHAINVAQNHKQAFIYDLKEGKCVSVNAFHLIKRLEKELANIDKNLDGLRFAWSVEKDGQLADVLSKSWDYVMLTRKQIAKRIVLLERQG